MLLLLLCGANHSRPVLLLLLLCGASRSRSCQKAALLLQAGQLPGGAVWQDGGGAPPRRLPPRTPLDFCSVACVFFTSK